jgi:hypothetical protein
VTVPPGASSGSLPVGALPVALPPAAPGGGPDPELIALTLEACPLVAGLHGGAYGEVASYLPGRRIRGVRVTVDAVEVHVVGRYPASMDQISGQVRSALAPLVGRLPVDVVIEDVALPGEFVTAPVAVDPTSVDAARADVAVPGTIPRPAGAAVPPLPVPPLPVPNRPGLDPKDYLL